MRDASDSPAISVVVPVRNGPEFIRRCISRLQASTFHDLEIVVVDDASTDDTADIAEDMQVRVIRLEENVGPAQARNIGAEAARAELVLFIDADVSVHPDTVEKVVETFVEHPEVDAVFGSYDCWPVIGNVISQYRNLYHHFVHQQASEDASTFWSGCGAIRRSVFLEMGGFDTSYGRPCIEDIELGVRLKMQNRRIMLNKSIQATHLKKWTLWGMIKTDFWDRGVPWTELMLRTRSMPNDLNLKTSQRICALLAITVLLLLLVGIAVEHSLILLPIAGVLSLVVLDRWSLHHRIPTSVRVFGLALIAGAAAMVIGRFEIWAWLAFALVLLIVWLNRGFYAFLARERVPSVAVFVVPLHVGYYVYSAAALATGLAFHHGRQLWSPRLSHVDDPRVQIGQSSHDVPQSETTSTTCS